MKSTRVAVLAALGMLLTSVSVYSFTPPGGVVARALDAAPTSIADSASSPGTAPVALDIARFNAGSTLMVEGRVGHSRLARGPRGETFVMVEVRGEGGAKGQPAPVNLSLVIDRSGSMKGTRMRNAISAATAAIDRLGDGDVVNVVTFDTQAQVVVPPTTITASARSQIAASVRGITLGGDTCLSCGIERGLQLVDQTAGKVNRMIVLSDGEANHGIRDLAGFRAVAQRAMSRSIAITTIGVDVDYNEKIMAALAQESNGRHYFVENDAALARVFEAEAEGLASTVASGAELAIDLGPGVELNRVFERSFRRSGSRITVPLGTFAQGDVKTVLLEVRVPSQTTGVVPVAGVELGYRDLVAGTEGVCSGELAVEISQDAGASELDPIVSGRVQRSVTAGTIREANTLFAQGNVVEAQRKLTTQQTNLKLAARTAASAAPVGRAKEIDADFQRQLAAVDGANTDFATPADSPQFATPPSRGPAAAPAPPQQTTRAGKSAVKLNEQRAFDLAF